MSREKCHFIGIGGIGMSGLARLMLKRNVEVSGSDLSSSASVEALKAAGANVHIGHSAQHVPAGARVIYTTGIDHTNPEFLAAKELGQCMLHRSELLTELTKDFHTIAVAGMHGKTTTSALMTAVLKHSGYDPSFAIGGVIADFQVNADHGDGKYFVIEACESDGSFLKYQPYAAIITNIDLEHMDHYGTETVLLQAFSDFLDRVISAEHLFWCADDSRLNQVAKKGISYGFSEEAACKISNFHSLESNSEALKSQIVFDIRFQGNDYKAISLSLLGKHNALNGAAVFALALSLGIPEHSIRKVFNSFGGIGRRCEIKGESRGVLFIDDYAHHPSEIKTTLQGVKEAVGERRLIALYQPHRYTRIRDCLGMYAEVFDEADEIVITSLYAAGELPIDGINDEVFFNDIKKSTKRPIKFIPEANLIETLASTLRPHDVLLSLGAGNITHLGKQLLNHFEKTPLPKLKVGLVFGGASGEHEISLLSAANIASFLDNELYDVNYFAISKTGNWVQGQQAKSYLYDQSSLEHYSQKLRMCNEVMINLAECEIVFPILHGPFGEDGRIQGLFEMLGKPYVGCSQSSSAVCMDKALTKIVAKAHGVETLDFISFNRYDWEKNEKELKKAILDKFQFPIFVKPCHLGSSLGVSKVACENELVNAIHLALEMDTKILIEPGIIARELEFSVLGNDPIKIFPPGEILSNGQVYYYDSKYTSGSMLAVTPRADLSKELIEAGMDLVHKAYRAAGCCGMARVDTFLDVNGKLWLNEINPIPGFTKNSLYPLMCAENGFSGINLMNRLIILGLHQHRTASV